MHVECKHLSATRRVERKKPGGIRQQGDGNGVALTSRGLDNYLKDLRLDTFGTANFGADGPKGHQGVNLLRRNIE